MARGSITIKQQTEPSDRARLLDWAARVPVGWRVEFRPETRSDAQNARMWSMLAPISKHGSINGQRFSADQWKCIFMQALRHELQVLPTLDGGAWFPVGFRSSKLTVREMADLQTFIEAWAADKGLALWRGEQPRG